VLNLRRNRRGGLAGPKGAGWAERVAGDGVWQVVALEDRGDELAAAVHAVRSNTDFR
jgi:hypothetical protein